MDELTRERWPFKLPRHEQPDSPAAIAYRRRVLNMSLELPTPVGEAGAASPEGLPPPETESEARRMGETE